MDYQSPLGQSFKLDNCDFSIDNSPSSGHEFVSPRNVQQQQQSNWRNNGPQRNFRGNQSFNNSPGYRGRNRSSWNTPKQRPNVRNESNVPISQYVHPSMLQDPWKELESKFQRREELPQEK